MTYEPYPGRPKAFIQYNGTAPVTSLYTVFFETRAVVTSFTGFAVTDTEISWTVSVGGGGVAGGFAAGSGIAGFPFSMFTGALWAPAEPGDELIVKVDTTSVVALCGFTLSGLLFPAA